MYPVSATGLLVPYNPLVRIVETKDYDAIEKLVFGRSFASVSELTQWMGLSRFPTPGQSLVDSIPQPPNQPDDLGMGAGVLVRDGIKGLTFSCAACHADNFFGTPILGMGTKRPRANEIFVLAKELEKLGIENISVVLGKISEKETIELKRFLTNFQSVGVQRPQHLGLDTSLAQVALSLARRKADPYATKDSKLTKQPRSLWPKGFVADSKPMPWWTMKYKTRWLADGSVVSGNPVFTNFLWNELGRGTDLKQLEGWMQNNQQAIRDLTAAVFASKAPRYGDFFGWNTVGLQKAKQGQKLFEQRCARCHGSYVKGWDAPSTDTEDLAALMKTTRVRYPKQTPVYDVGTDPNRAKGMTYFADALNQLAISKSMQTVVKPQTGYVPPPLNGIFARYPYLHNNSIPNLCALLTPSAQRPKKFVQGPAHNKKTDFDLDCVGYPTGDAIPAAWKEDTSAHVDTTKPGLSNKGHDVGIFVDTQGKSLLSTEQRAQLIAFLKTL